MDNRYAIVIPVDKSAILLRCDDGGTLELQTLQDLVEGYIETVPVMPCVARGMEPGVKPVLIVNEEGKLRQLPLNIVASIMADLMDDEIAGNAVLMCARDDELIGFNREAAEIIMRWCSQGES